MRDWLDEFASRGYLAVGSDARYHGEWIPGEANGAREYVDAATRAWRSKPGEAREYPFWYDSAYTTSGAQSTMRWQARAATIQATHAEAAKDLGEAEVNERVVRELWTKLIPGTLDQFDCPSMLPGGAAS